VTATAPRPLPVINEMNRYFWMSGSDGNLRILRCNACGRYHHPYVARCSDCGSRTVAPAVVSGRAILISTSVNYQSWFPAVPVPYVLGLAQLIEQDNIRLLTNVVNVPWQFVKPDMRLKVCFERQGDIFVPLFEPS
jgi:uncharacterized protein